MAILAFCVAILGTAVFYMRLTRATELDQRMCPVSGPVGQFVLLVDKTDPLNFTQKQAFQAFLEQLITQRIPAGYLLSVFVLDNDYTATARPVFEECNPGDGTGKSEMNANLSHLKKRFEQGFREPMLRLADELEAKKSSRFSPIFEMLEMTAINGFRKQNVTGPRRLIIVSDMLHNTPEYSMYRGNFDFDRFHDSDYGRKATADLTGVEVEIEYLLNTPKLQTRRNLKFWEDYFAAGGAHIVAVRPLEG
ncbi:MULTISPECIES: hypothetical protein [Paraburkholderia]|uniref:hypothetical protein n=1 Tax=Paraburkholderia TaxID=1822464 RepID=UPI0022510DC9|nr:MULTISPECIES: hypothetical protein [Paraburkholderia]MCX4176699.1 hypothetical protein [Paraburkholderia madseniana]MDQ6464690.1 hypothetical protein [Paraburkholderia madseniana]